MLLLYSVIMIVIVVLALRTWKTLDNNNLTISGVTPTEIVMYTLSIYLVLMIVNDLVH